MLDRFAQAPDVADDEPLAEARMMAATCGDVRIVCVYAPNGRTVDSPFYHAKLGWFERLARWFAATRDPKEPLVLGGDFNVCPTDLDVYDPEAFIGATHVTAPERARFHLLLDAGMVDAFRALQPGEPGFTWWDYRQGHFHRNMGLRIDAILLSQPLADDLIECGIDRDFRKGPRPSDHAPLLCTVAR